MASHRFSFGDVVGKTRCACGKRVGFQWGVGCGQTRAGAPRYLHAIYTTWNVCTSVWRMEGIIGVLLKTEVLY